MKNKNGFTLIELLVVVLIIGILASIALPMYQKAIWKARFAEVVSVAHSIERSLDLYALENGCFSTGGEPTYLTPDDLDLEIPLSGATPQPVGWPDGYCTKHACFTFSCYSLIGHLYKDAANPSYSTQILRIMEDVQGKPKWQRDCIWMDLNSTRNIGKTLCTSTQWDHAYGSL